jgi:hypothetical protein
MPHGAYHWIDTGWHLQLNYGTTAYVKPDPGGLFQVVIHWNGREIRGRAASLAQGRRHIERWISARGGKYEKRRPYEPSAQLRRKWAAEEALVALVRKR